MFELLVKVVVISLSGALAPGPLTAATAASGLKKGWKAGLSTSIGHTLIELPYVILLSFGVAAIFKNPKANFFLGVLGGLFLLFFGITTIKDAIQKNPNTKTTGNKRPTPLITGIVLTAFNPYFLAWWIGIGTPLISEAMNRAGLLGIGLLYLFHVWLDYGWLILIAGLASFGRIQNKVFRFILLGLGLIVIWFGIDMLVKTIQNL